MHTDCSDIAGFTVLGFSNAGPRGGERNLEVRHVTSTSLNSVGKTTARDLFCLQSDLVIRQSMNDFCRVACYLDAQVYTFVT